MKRVELTIELVHPPWWATAIIMDTAPSDEFVPPVMNLDGPPHES